MSIVIDNQTPVLVQGFTGRIGSFHSKEMMEYGTHVVGGVTPGRGGTVHHGLPVFDTVKAAVAATSFFSSVAFFFLGSQECCLNSISDSPTKVNWKPFSGLFS